MNRQNRRHPSNPYLPAFNPSKRSVVTSNENRKNTSVNTEPVKKRKG